jgi:hypothetical protein
VFEWASADLFAEHNGAFLIDCHVNDDIIGYAKEPESAQRLWALSEKLVGESFKP